MTPEPRRVGVFGGTFDPPHRGHVEVVGDAAEALALDEVLWIPAARSPHKPDAPLTDAALRAEMVECATSDHDRFTVDLLELERPGLSYTVDTLEALAERHPTDKLFLLVGGDQYRAFDRWKDPSRIRALATVIVMEREGEGGAHFPDVEVSIRRVDVSSSEVRERVRDGRSISGLVPPCVEERIAAHGLYVG